MADLTNALQFLTSYKAFDMSVGEYVTIGETSCAFAPADFEIGRVEGRGAIVDLYFRIQSNMRYFRA